jgi:hypothetical protein
VRRRLVTLVILAWLTMVPAACATPGRPRTAQDECVNTGGVWHAPACERQAGGGGM